MKYEGMKEASFPEVVPSSCTIVKVTATDNSVAEELRCTNERARTIPCYN